MDAPSLLELLAFLQYSFGGGTDVDRPLELSLDRLEQKDWAQVSLQVLPASSLCEYWVTARILHRVSRLNKCEWDCHPDSGLRQLLGDMKHSAETDAGLPILLACPICWDLAKREGVWSSSQLHGVASAEHFDHLGGAMS